MIVLARCDDRLIHGQCMTVIVQEYDIRSIIIVDNETAENPILRVVFETAGTNSAPVAVCTAFEALSRISEAMISPVNVLLLMKSPETYLRLLGDLPGLPKELNIGPMSKRPGTISVTRAVHLLPKEAEAVHRMDEMGIRVYFRQVPTEKTVEWAQIQKKFE